MCWALQLDGEYFHIESLVLLENICCGSSLPLPYPTSIGLPGRQRRVFPLTLSLFFSASLPIREQDSWENWEKSIGVSQIDGSRMGRDH